MGAWWPLATHTRARDADGERSVDVTVEPRVGGRIFETLADGRELDWGEVLVWTPGNVVELAWRLGLPADQATRVAVRFDPLGSDGCRVTLTHSDWERLGEAGIQRREGYASGWATVFESCYADHVGAHGERANRRGDSR
ncbi:MAG: SRPBCC domain-containing protein [Pseudomonadales bacterium]